MFPLNDFNFVACALATFSAAVGYNVSRKRARDRNSNGNGHVEGERGKRDIRFGFLKFHRRNSTASMRSTSIALTDAESDGTVTEPPLSPCSTPVLAEQPESFSDEVEDGSLKRKRMPSPEVVRPDMPPVKRRRTPPAECEETHGELAVKVEETSPRLVSSNDSPKGDVADIVFVHGLSSEVPVAPPTSITVVASSEEQGIVGVPTNPMARPARPIHPFVGTAVGCSAAQSPPWLAPNPIVAVKPSSAFQAFSGKPSSFANAPFADTLKAPVWSTAEPSSGTTLGELPMFASSDSSPLAALTHTASTQKIVTGEEEEEVEMELKGAKVFIKRGDRDFCEGILGNLRLLKHKETGDERLLFRRELVWKVSMNVKLRPTVRCSFDEEQGALRLTLKEFTEETQEEQLVIYALRRGKAPRSAFAEFAKAVVESNTQLQEHARA